MKRNIIFYSLLVGFSNISLQGKPMPTEEQVEFCKNEIVPYLNLSAQELRNYYLDGKLEGKISDDDIEKFDECIKEQME